MSIATPPLKKHKLSTILDDLCLQPSLIEKLKTARLYSFKSILELSRSELQTRARLSPSEANNVIEVTSQHVLKNDIIPAITLLNAPERENFSPDIFENMNGIQTGTITEICGESGCGKTQLCLHLSITAQLPTHAGGLDSPVVYIHTEGDFPIKRFQGMVNAFEEKHPLLKNLKLADNVMLKKVFNPIEAVHVLQKTLPTLMKQIKKPKLIIIDSVAALLRSEGKFRTSLTQQLAFEIWKLANTSEVALICVNQISGMSKSHQNGVLSTGPSLGLLWSTILTTRLRVYRKPSPIHPSLRTLEVIFSSYHAKSNCVNFTISENGIEIINI